VIDSKPSDGLKVIGEKNGYASKESADQAMKDEPKCKAPQAAVEQDAGRLKAAEAKAKKLGVHNLTQEDIDGLTYEQIKELRGY
jgi:16S rRNA C967 or C1407 C5-methylase (RsmB/RsmF family)